MEQDVRGTGEEVVRQRTTGDRRQLGDVRLIVVDDSDDHADAADATLGRLDRRQLGQHVRVSVADDDGDVRNVGAVAALRLERRVVDESERGRRVRRVTDERHATDRLDDVLLHLPVVVHVERDERAVAPVDETDSRPVHADVQFVDAGDDRLFDDVESYPVDASRTVQDKHEVQQPAAVCKMYTSREFSLHLHVVRHQRVRNTTRYIENTRNIF